MSIINLFTTSQVLGQSSFGWWAAYLHDLHPKQTHSSFVVIPRDSRAGVTKFVAEDYFLPHWVTLSQSDIAENESLNFTTNSSNSDTVKFTYAPTAESSIIV